MALGTGFHLTALCVAVVLWAILVADLDFHPRNPVAESSECALHEALDFSGQFLTALDVVVRVDLNLHDDVLRVLGCLPFLRGQVRMMNWGRSPSIPSRR